MLRVIIHKETKSTPPTINCCHQLSEAKYFLPRARLRYPKTSARAAVPNRVLWSNRVLVVTISRPIYGKNFIIIAYHMAF